MNNMDKIKKIKAFLDKVDIFIENFQKYMMTHGLAAISFTITSVFCFYMFNKIMQGEGVLFWVRILVAGVVSLIIGAFVAIKKYKEQQAIYNKKNDD
ncbi:MAG: hypothetical protein JWM44_2078 [Bacilli bacterium]|nr:hypothetical protein [Bacilli bacterium]